MTYKDYDDYKDNLFYKKGDYKYSYRDYLENLKKDPDIISLPNSDEKSSTLLQKELDDLRRKLAKKEKELAEKTKTQEELEAMQKKINEDRMRLEAERLVLDKDREELEAQRKQVRQALIDSSEIQLT